MSTLIVSDVFEAYYDGRKGAFVAEAARTGERQKRDEKTRAEPANKDLSIVRAA